jgi:hypothetical protein
MMLVTGVVSDATAIAEVAAVLALAIAAGAMAAEEQDISHLGISGEDVEMADGTAEVAGLREDIRALAAGDR